MSNQTNEFEARVMISEEQYHTIMSFFRAKESAFEVIKNENYYFDTPALTLANSRISLRLRIIDEHEYEFTCKIKEKEGSLEINDYLNNEVAQLLLHKNVLPDGEVKNFLSTLSADLSSCCLLASLNNKRLEIKEADHLLVIDKNTYGQSIDFNLEVESTDMQKANQILAHYCAMFNIKNTDEKYRGKIWRAIESCSKKT